MSETATHASRMLASDMAETLQIRNVPPELHALIASHAKAEGLTISQYLLRRIAEIEGKPPIRDVLERHWERNRGRKRPAPNVVVDVIREHRGWVDDDDDGR